MCVPRRPDAVTFDDSGVHVNHLEGHQRHLDGSAGSTHTYETEEAEAFAAYINHALAEDADVAHLLPFDPLSKDLFEKLNDGLVLLKLLPRGCVNEKKVNKGSNLSIFKKQENLNYFIQLAQEEGMQAGRVNYTEL